MSGLLGIKKYERSQEPKKIYLDDEESVYVIGRPYSGAQFAGSAARISAKYASEMRVAQKKKNYKEIIRIKKLIGLEAAVSGNNPCIVEIGDETGIVLRGEEIVDLLMKDEYQHLMNIIDIKLDSSSDEFMITEESAAEQGE